MGTVAIFAAHPDDEVLGCGGTIAWHIAKGDDVHVIILAEGITSREDNRNVNKSKKFLNQLIKSAKKAHEILGTTSLKFLNLPDNRMDSINLLNVIKIVVRVWLLPICTGLNFKSYDFFNSLIWIRSTSSNYSFIGYLMVNI